MKRCKKLLTCLFIILIFSVGCQKTMNELSQGTNVKEITPIIDNNGADPWIIKKDNQYYYSEVNEGKLNLYSSKNLTDIVAGKVSTIIEDSSDLYNFWAPELHYTNGKWYVYVAACTKKDDIHRMYVLSNESNDPMEGSWTYSKVDGMDDKFAIDGTLLEIEDKRYFIWSGWEGDTNVAQNLYLSEMISPTETKGEKILISSPEYQWEKIGDPLVNEGPQVIINKNKINLVYSASGSWTDDYCIGLLTTDVGADIKNPDSWIKKSEPIFKSGNNVFGPGHNSFTVSPDGTENIMVYHSARWQGGGWNRFVRFQYFEFDDKGEIKLGTPIASDELLPIPSGEPDRLGFTYEDFQLEGEFDLTQKDGALSKKTVTGFEERESSLLLEFENTHNRQSSIVIYGRIENNLGENNVVLIEVEINGETRIEKLYPSKYFQPITINTNLPKGKNEIRIRADIGGDTVSVDRIEVCN